MKIVLRNMGSRRYSQNNNIKCKVSDIFAKKRKYFPNTANNRIAIKTKASIRIKTKSLTILL